MEGLLDKLQHEGYLRTPRIIEAFRRIRREDFLPDDRKVEASVNAPLPIGYGQTISQPLTVAFMLELLKPERGDTILDVGSGSGWQTALLADIVGPEGHVTAIERIPQLRRFGERNVAAYDFHNVEFHSGDGSQGFRKRAPYDRIVVAAAAATIPPALKEQLVVGGRLVIPVGGWLQDIVLVEKKRRAEFHEARHPGFRFVPLIGEGSDDGI